MQNKCNVILALVLTVLCVSASWGAVKKPNPFDVEAREYLGTPKSEAAVNKGLEFLVKRQQADGHWATDSMPSEPAVTGIVTLAFLAAGHQPGQGKYGMALTRAVDWLLESVKKNGQIVHGDNGPPMYGHGFATLCLAELYGMTHRADLRPKLESAIQLIVSTQNAEGGWRYQPQVSDADISVTAVQVVALRAAFNAGIKVPTETVNKAVKYIKRCQNNPDGGFSYIAGTNGSGPPRTGAGVTCLYLCGEGKSAEAKNGIRYLTEHNFARSQWEYRQHYMYAMYYCTQAFYQVGGESWKSWFTVTRDRLITEQSVEGSWSDGPGKEYATGMAVLVLQVPAGLLPIYQK